MSGDGFDSGEVGTSAGVSPAGDMEKMRAATEARLMKYSVPTRMATSQFTVNMSRIDALFGAKTAEQKESVKNDITYLAITHGGGPNVDWDGVIAHPDGCKAVSMSEIVDGIVTRRYWRKFLTNFSERATLMHNSSGDLQAQLKDRAVRNGLPVTETLAVIDFLDNSRCSSGQVAARSRMKYNAVSRANDRGLTSMDKDSRRAHDAMVGSGDSPSVSGDF